MSILLLLHYITPGFYLYTWQSIHNLAYTFLLSKLIAWSILCTGNLKVRLCYCIKFKVHSSSDSQEDVRKVKEDGEAEQTRSQTISDKAKVLTSNTS